MFQINPPARIRNQQSCSPLFLTQSRFFRNAMRWSAQYCETNIYRPEKNWTRLESRMQMRTSEGVPEFHWKAFRCAFSRGSNESLLRYVST